MIQQQIRPSFDEALENIRGFFICSHNRVTDKSIKYSFFANPFYDQF